MISTYIQDKFPSLMNYGASDRTLSLIIESRKGLLSVRICDEIVETILRQPWIHYNSGVRLSMYTVCICTTLLAKTYVHCMLVVFYLI